MRSFYQSLNEKDRRRFAGFEALQFGHGGRNYIAGVLGCSRNTVSKGALEVSGLPRKQVEECIREKGKKNMKKKKDCIRKKGGGRKPYYTKMGQELDEKFLEVLREHTAGDPMDEKVRWTNLTHNEIVKALRVDHNLGVSRTVVRKLLKKHGYRRRKAQKRLGFKKDIANRNEQFENILRLKADYAAAGNPAISLDSKKKEQVGNLYRDGRLYTLEELVTYDHDFPSYAEGVIIPHCIYDWKLNTGYIQLGNSHDTSEFACASLRHWWNNYGQQNYPKAPSILVLCDGGGSNSSRHYIFKQDLQLLADELGIEIRIAHFPPYCSKYNPIEHRFFPHVTRACQGVIFTSIALVKELMEKTSTKTGLNAFVHILDKVYETGRKVADGFKQNMDILFDAYLPKWNYCTIPHPQTNAQLI
ncbi:MAG: ISAzo13 family transposase [bacterium]|nr:ISAzo13 family transposase [bacterium]